MIAPITLSNGKTFEITRRAEGSGLKGTIYWKAICKEAVTMEDAADLQRICGYDSAGYGFSTFTIFRTVNARYAARWSCSTSSD